MSIASKDWSFDAIRLEDPARADRLEHAGSPQLLLRALSQALEKAIERNTWRIAWNVREGAFVEVRAIVQFQVMPQTYDWFFNARTGYRSRFWIGPTLGCDFNRQVAESLRQVLLLDRLNQNLEARRIVVIYDRASRHEIDLGSVSMCRDELVGSMDPEVSKIWISEWLYSADRQPDPIGFAVLSAAQQSAKLGVPKWADAINPSTGDKGEGLRAPYPTQDYSWLDLKGGFLNPSGDPSHINAPDKRASNIHERGWT
jgi:hypothetical protein